MIIFLAGLRQIPHDMYEAASLDGASQVAAVLEDHPAAADAGHLLQRRHPDDRGVQGLHAGLHHLRRHRRSDQLDAVLHALPLPGGLRLLPHGLRLGARLDPPRDHRRLHRASRSSPRATGCTMMTDVHAHRRRRRPGRRRPPPAASSRWSCTSLLIAASIVMLYPLLWMLVGVGPARERDLHLALDLAVARSASTPTSAAGTGCRSASAPSS